MRLTIRVIPRSKKNGLEGEKGSEPGEKVLKARLTAPPVDGMANEALIVLLAEHFHVARRTIRIVRGTTSRQKMVEIDELTLDDLYSRLP